MNELPSIEDVVVQTTAVLINLAAKALAEENPDEARQGIEAARALLPQCPEDVQKQLRDPLAHLQMEFVKASQPKKPESKLWTPGS